MATINKLASPAPSRNKLMTLLKDPDFRAALSKNALSALSGAVRGITTDVLGSPSDLLSMFKYSTMMGGEPTKIPLGSEQLGNYAENAGLLPPRENNISYRAGEFLGPIAAMGVPKAVSAAGDVVGNALGDLAAHQGPAAQFGMVGYHGTPHRFAPTPDNPLGAFDLSKIGTGEGAQAYGHGIYIAEAPGVANEYARMFEKASASNRQLSRLRDAAPAGSAEWKHYDDLIKAGGQGSLYHVDLPDEHIANMLNWDRPLSEQAPSVQEAFKRLGMDESVFPHWTGQQAYEGEVRALSEFDGMSKGDARKRYSEQLNALGIPGIKYLDAGSRNFVPPRIESGANGHTVYWGNDPIPVGTFKSLEEAQSVARDFDTRTRNFVVFSPDILKIIKRE